MGERTAGPFEYFQDIHGGVNGDTIRADAQDPGLKAGTIQALAGELEGDSQKVAGQLSGDITADVQANPKTASDTAKALAAKGHYAVGLIGSFAGMVDAFDSTVNDLNHRYKTDLASAMRYAGQAAAATEDKADDAKVTEAGMGPAIKANLQPEYKAAVAKLDNDADSIASKFKQGATTANVRELIKAGLIPLSAAAFYPGLELTAAEKTSYWRNTLGNMTSQQQIDWINAHKDELPPEAAEFVQPDVQEHFAEEVANDIKDPDDIDQDTVNLLTFLSNEQPFSHQLYTDVSPDEMSDAIRSLSSDAFPAQDQRPMHDRVENAQLYKGFLDAAGVAFATYTKGTGAYAPPSDLADTYFKAITDDDHPSNAAALTMLIRHGGEQTSIEENFIRDLTGRTYEWELSHDGDPVWGPRNDDEYGIKDPTTVDTGDPDDPYDDYVTGRNAADGLANLLDSLTKEGSKAAVAELRKVDVTALMSDVQAPTLVLHRSGLSAITVEMAREMAATIPNARLMLFDGAGIAPFLGGGKEIAAAIRDFVLRTPVTPVASAAASTPDPSVLTPRETEVLRLIAAGRTSSEISDELSLSVRTVGRHITNIYGKIGARTRADATAYAIRARIA